MWLYVLMSPGIIAGYSFSVLTSPASRKARASTRAPHLLLPRAKARSCRITQATSLQILSL